MAWDTVILSGSFLLFLVSKAYGADLPAQITKSIDTATVSAGQEGKLNCSVAGREQNNAYVFWTKMADGSRSAKLISRNGAIERLNQIDSKGEEKFKITVTQVSDTVEIFTLHIRRVLATDGGLYECRVYMPGLPVGSNFPRAVGELVVQLPPSLSDSDLTPYVSVLEGQNATLRCDASGVPTPILSWSRANGGPLPDGRLTQFGKTLVIQKADSETAGVYRCKADNNVRPPATADVWLQVNTRPVAKPFRDSYGQSPDKNFQVELACIVSGSPSPDVAWYKHEGSSLEIVLNDERHKINKMEIYPGHNGKSGDLWLTLRIFQVQVSDFGNYTCMGENIYGRGGAVVALFSTPTCQGSACRRDSPVSGALLLVATDMLTVAMATLLTIWRIL